MRCLLLKIKNYSELKPKYKGYKSFLSEYNPFIDYYDFLLLAIKRGKILTVKRIIETKNSHLKFQGRQFDILEHAIIHNQVKIVKYLLKLHNEDKFFLFLEKDDNYLLIRAYERHHNTIVGLLFKQEKVYNHLIKRQHGFYKQVCEVIQELDRIKSLNNKLKDF